MTYNLAVWAFYVFNIFGWISPKKKVKKLKSFFKIFSLYFYQYSIYFSQQKSNKNCIIGDLTWLTSTNRFIAFLVKKMEFCLKILRKVTILIVAPKSRKGCPKIKYPRLIEKTAPKKPKDYPEIENAQLIMNLPLNKSGFNF